MSLLIKLAISLGCVLVLVAASFLWETRRARERQRKLRERGSDRTIRSEHLSNKETGHWNLS